MLSHFSDTMLCIVKFYLRNNLCLFTTVSLIGDNSGLRLFALLALNDFWVIRLD